MKISITKDAVYKKKWDDFITSNENGSHLQLSTWLQSYDSYGFNYELYVAEENNEIIGGFGAVIAKVLFFKFYIIPYGPIVKEEKSSILEQLLKAIPSRAKELKCCYCQVSFPTFRNPDYGLDYYKNLDEIGYKKGNLFKYVYSSSGLNWLDFKKYNSTDEILLDFKSSVRRDIRSAERKGHKVKFLVSELEVKIGYDLCLENANNNNYSLRDWNSFKPTILSLIEKGNGKFIAAYKDNDLKGVLFLVKAGNYYTYILGGTKKEKPDLLTGHLLQWEAIKLSFIEKCDGYNISLGGSDGVKEFKNRFITRQYNNKETKYYVVLNKKIFKFFLFFEKKIKPQKRNIAAILAFLKREY
jgi:lipid II:glycine glycyltransferase (peptidoglycan interpeptide bridge formation enzyme)